MLSASSPSLLAGSTPAVAAVHCLKREPASHIKWLCHPDTIAVRSHDHAAVHLKDLTSHVGSRWFGGEEGHEACNLVWMPITTCDVTEDTTTAQQTVPPQRCMCHLFADNDPVVHGMGKATMP